MSNCVIPNYSIDIENGSLKRNWIKLTSILLNCLTSDYSIDTFSPCSHNNKILHHHDIKPTSLNFSQTYWLTDKGPMWVFNLWAINDIWINPFKVSDKQKSTSYSLHEMESLNDISYVVVPLGKTIHIM